MPPAEAEGVCRLPASWSGAGRGLSASESAAGVARLALPASVGSAQPEGLVGAAAPVHRAHREGTTRCPRHDLRRTRVAGREQALVVPSAQPPAAGRTLAAVNGTRAGLPLPERPRRADAARVEPPPVVQLAQLPGVHGPVAALDRAQACGHASTVASRHASAGAGHPRPDRRWVAAVDGAPRQTEPRVGDHGGSDPAGLRRAARSPSRQLTSRSRCAA